jgi:hypothetical protein
MIFISLVAMKLLTWGSTPLRALVVPETGEIYFDEPE